MPREDERFDERFDDRDDYGRGDDDYVDRIRRPSKPSGMDGFFLNTNMAVLVIFGFCCGGVALILGIVGLAICKDPEAKQRALIVTIISGIVVALGVMAQVANLATHPQGFR